MWTEWANPVFIAIFLVQLLISQVFFVIYYPRRAVLFPLRAAVGVLAYFGCGMLLWYLAGFLPGRVSQVFWLAISLTLGGLLMIPFEISYAGGLYAVTGAYLTQHFSHCLSSTLFVLLGGQPSMPINPLRELSLDVLVYLLVAAVVFFLFIRPRKFCADRDELNLRHLMLGVIAVLICVVLRNWFVDIAFAGNPLDNGLMLAANSFGMVSCYLGIVILFGLVEQSRMVREQKLLENLLEVEQERNRITQETIETIDQKCHDLKHQLRYLESHIDDPESREAISEIKRNISSFSRIVKTGNEALDLVFVEKLLLCEKYGIQFSYLVDGEKLSFMAPLDLVTMCGNALDNEIEYLRSVPDPELRFMSMTVKERNGAIYMHLDNYCGEVPVMEDGLPITHNPDKTYHGFGTKSIRGIAEKYGGLMNISVENGRYNLDILFTVPGGERAA